MTLFIFSILFFAAGMLAFYFSLATRDAATAKVQELSILLDQARADVQLWKTAFFNASAALTNDTTNEPVQLPKNQPTQRVRHRRTSGRAGRGRW